MSESYPSTQEAIEQEDAANWLAENYFFGEDIGEAGWTDYLKNIATGTVTGLATGGIPGAIIGGGTAAYQTSQQPKARHSALKQKQAGPSSPPLTPVVAPASTVVATQSPAIVAALPQVTRSPQVISPELSKQVERALREVLPSLLPKLVSEFSTQQSQQSVAKESSAESTDGEFAGDYVADDIFPIQFEEDGLDEPLSNHHLWNIYS